MSERLTLREHHERSHYYGYGSAVPMGMCWFCQRNAAVCKSKVAYASPREAHEAAVEHNQRDEWAATWRPYRCRYCEGYHLTSKVGDGRRSRSQLKRIEKQRRKTLRPA